MTNRPAGDLTNDLTKQVKELFRDELRIAVTEMREKAVEMGVGGAFLLAAGALALYAGSLVLHGVTLILARVLPTWLAAMVVGLLLAAASAVAAAIGLDRVRRAMPLVPEQAAAEIAKDAQAVEDNVNI